ncbi:MAG: radical SAM protein [Bacteroidales bacterium]|nr:radical SAM protein [Bacteroidales bacterium]HOO66675.1 radical SAM protein [Bacteroidales bacterium]HPE22889.1 radical SAM protein [Bacteroidales bacterium]HPJ05447.1 radical SAM protein [Bacteroidales bacterium]HRW28249.1 radical SAM protein [Bacteroidales bacterium]
MEETERRVFGPVPSRRLGKSLGVNSIPFKVCSYSCRYCQLGKGIRMQAERQVFFDPEMLADEVRELLDKTRGTADFPDYVTIVPDGEPTLDINLGVLIDRLKALGVPVAVITNSSLLHMQEVRDELMKADYVSVKADTFSRETWKRLNIPHRTLEIDKIRDGIMTFSGLYWGKLVTETMLVKDINDSHDEINNTAGIVRLINPHTAYISIPTRPPAYSGVMPADEDRVLEAYHAFAQQVENVELLTGYEGNEFSSTGMFREDILAITAVHPMREDAVTELLARSNESEETLEMMIDEELLRRVAYGNHNYYMRRFRR